MALAIVVLIIGVPAGLFMLLRARKARRNPVAGKTGDNDYDNGYLVLALPGIGVLAASLIVAGLAWSKDSHQRDVAAQIRQQQTEATPAAPAPEDRGPLPVIGYTVEPEESGGVRYRLFVLQPPGVLSGVLKRTKFRPGKFQCVRWVDSEPTGDKVRVNARLSWEPTQPGLNAESDACRVGDLSTWGWVDSEFVSVTGTPELVTDSAIVDVNGKVLAPAAPGNVVPKLDATPRR